MHNRGPCLLAASLLAILSITSLLLVAANGSDDATNEALPHHKQQRMLDQQEDDGSTSQVFDLHGTALDDKNNNNNNQLTRSIEYPRQMFRLHILDSRPSPKNRQHSAGSVKGQPMSSSDINEKQAHKSKPTKIISNATLKKLLSQAMQQQQNRLANLTLISSAAKYQPNKSSSPSSSSSETNSDQASNTLSGPSSNTADNTGSKHRGSNMGTSLLTKPGSNFKFVFLQRAAANGNTNSTTNNNQNKTTKTQGPIDNSNNNNNRLSAAAASSLAASISKQLASSLLYSASNLVSTLNLTSQAPSLSDLKTQLTKSIINNNDDDNPESTNDIPRSTTSKQPTTSTEDRADKAELQPSQQPTSPISTKTTSSIVANAIISSLASSTKRPKYRKNPKIYNLPVKFVSNGQPTQIVIQTIRQHLAAMKRMQNHQTSSSGGLSSSRHQGDYLGGMVRHANNQPTGGSPFNSNSGATKSKKIKGVNSRLIYLPLKMLINGKPSRISVSSPSRSSLAARQEATKSSSSKTKRKIQSDDSEDDQKSTS